MTQKSIQINDATQAQIDDLVAWGHGPHFSSIVRTAIDRMWYQEQERRSAMVKFGYYEDNGGGLHLYVFDADVNMIAGYTNLEYAGAGEWNDVKAGMMTDPLKEIDGWDSDSRLENPQEHYEAITATEFGWQLVASEKGLYPDRMGAAARKYFGIEAE